MTALTKDPWEPRLDSFLDFLPTALSLPALIEGLHLDLLYLLMPFCVGIPGKSAFFLKGKEVTMDLKERRGGWGAGKRGERGNSDLDILNKRRRNKR